MTPPTSSIHDGFRRFAQRAAHAIGSSYAFALAFASIATWGLLGPSCHFSDSWQLVINTGTTINTFLVVFLIQNTQNRDSKAMHLKLDELLRVIGPARNSLVDLEDLPDEDLRKLELEFRRLRTREVQG